MLPDGPPDLEICDEFLTLLCEAVITRSVACLTTSSSSHHLGWYRNLSLRDGPAASSRPASAMSASIARVRAIPTRAS